MAKCFFVLFCIFSLATLAACDSFGESPEEAYVKPAYFKVSNSVVNKDVEPFTATIVGFGNSLIRAGSGFEPVIYRDMLIAQQDSDDKVIASQADISHYDTLREGVLDGAHIFVYRIENGRFRLVRQDAVTKGGFHASGWVPLIKGNAVVSPDQTHFQFRWGRWNRPHVPYYFTVRAVDQGGNLSAPSNVISEVRPDNVGKGIENNALIPYRKPKMAGKSALPAPENLQGTVEADGSLSLNWKPVADGNLAGYLVYRSDYAPSQQHGYYLQLANHAKSSEQYIKAGDMVILDKKFYNCLRDRDFSNRVWGAFNAYRVLMPISLFNIFPDESPDIKWELVPHRPNTIVTDPGETYLRLKLSGNKAFTTGVYNNAGTDQDWYDVLETKPYKVEIWLRYEGKGPASVQFGFNAFYQNKISPIKFVPGSKWHKFTATFTPPVVRKHGPPNMMELKFSGAGTFNVDNFRVYRADTPYLDYTKKQYAELKQSGIQALRTHDLVKTGRHTYDLDQLTNTGGVISGTHKLNTLPQTLRMMKKAGVRPWLQIEPHLSPQEWRDFVEYMAAPYDPRKDTPKSKPWAYKRYKQGQIKPWTSVFDKIYFEIGNETWNRLFAPWVFRSMQDSITGKKYSPGQVYGLFQEHVIETMKSSPYWNMEGLDNKFVFMLGGWNGQDYGGKAAVMSPDSSYMNIAAYTGGWDEGEGPPREDPESYFNVLNNVSQSDIPSADRYSEEVREINTLDRNRRLHVGTYESGPGYAMNGLNHMHVTKEQAEQQEHVMKSKAAGTASLDAFLARAYRGFTIQNFFTFGAGTLWKSHAKWYHGGQAYPSWELLSLFNNKGTGDMLKTETISVPTTNLKAFARRKGVKNAPLVAVYALRKGSRVSVFVISRKISNYPVAGDAGYTPVTIELPFSSANKITLFRMTGKARDDNVLSDNVKIRKMNLPAASFNSKFKLNKHHGLDGRGLPPAATLLYVFDGVKNIN